MNRSVSRERSDPASEVELLSPYVTGSLSPARFGLVSTKVRRAKAAPRREGLRALAVGVGAFLVVSLGLFAGVLVVLLSGIR